MLGVSKGVPQHTFTVNCNTPAKRILQRFTTPKYLIPLCLSEIRRLYAASACFNDRLTFFDMNLPCLKPVYRFWHNKAKLL